MLAKPVLQRMTDTVVDREAILAELDQVAHDGSGLRHRGHLQRASARWGPLCAISSAL